MGAVSTLSRPRRLPGLLGRGVGARVAASISTTWAGGGGPGLTRGAVEGTQHGQKPVSGGVVAEAGARLQLPIAAGAAA